MGRGEKLEINPTGRKCTEMKKTQGLLGMILFVEIFANVKLFGF